MVMRLVASVCVSLHLSVCNALTFERLDLDRSFWYAGTALECSGQIRISCSDQR